MIQQHELDWCQARTNRDNGMNVAELSAESNYPGWPEEALNKLKEFISFNSSEFMTEDFRAWTKKQGFHQPNNLRAWGPITLRAARLGLIRKVGLRATSNPNANNANAAVWIRS